MGVVGVGGCRGREGDGGVEGATSLDLIMKAIIILDLIHGLALKPPRLLHNRRLELQTPAETATARILTKACLFYGRL